MNRDSNWKTSLTTLLWSERKQEDDFLAHLFWLLQLDATTCKCPWKMSAEIESHQPAFFPFKKISLATTSERAKNIFPSELFLRVSVCSWIGKTTMRKESCSGKCTLENIRKNLFTFFLFSSPTPTSRASENPLPWNWKRKTFCWKWFPLRFQC